VDQPCKGPNEDEIDEIVTAEADDDAAWEKSIKVRRAKDGMEPLPSELAAKARLARLRRAIGLRKQS